MKTITALIALTLAATPYAHAETDDQVAQTFLSPAFATFASQNPGLRTDVSWTTLRLDLDHTGKMDYLAIGYGNAHIACLRVIRTVTTPTLAGDTPTVACDLGPRLSAIDLDGDGVPEIGLECTNGNHGTPFTSFFRSTGTGVQPLNPPHPRRAHAWWPIANANLVDLDGTGTLAVLEPAMDNDATAQQWNVYRLTGGKLVKSAAAPIFFDRFYRDNGTPAPEEQTFTVSPGPYIITVINGLRAEHMVSSAVITINGTVVLSPDSFSEKVRTVSANLTLPAANTITVDLRSAPGAYIDIVITPKP
jgi:hypothetical protein